MIDIVDIWEPKYSNKTFRIDVNKVKSGDNFIRFTKADHLEGMLFWIRGDDIYGHPIKPNGRGRVYEVPMDKLENVTAEMSAD